MTVRLVRIEAGDEVLGGRGGLFLAVLAVASSSGAASASGSRIGIIQTHLNGTRVMALTQCSVPLTLRFAPSLPEWLVRSTEQSSSVDVAVFVLHDFARTG